jgi:hypothetical protein
MPTAATTPAQELTALATTLTSYETIITNIADITWEVLAQRAALGTLLVTASADLNTIAASGVGSVSNAEMTSDAASLRVYADYIGNTTQTIWVLDSNRQTLASTLAKSATEFETMVRTGAAVVNPSEDGL